MRQSHITFKQFNLTVNNKKFRSNRLEFQPSFIVKLLFITVLQSRGACFRTFREQSKFFKSGNLFVIYLDKLSIYKWTEPWNIKGRFPESWGLRASVSSSPLPLPLPFFLLPLQFSCYNSSGNAYYAACYAGYVETYAWNSTVKTVIVTHNEGGAEGKRGLITSFAFHELRIKYLRFHACSNKGRTKCQKRYVSPIL